MNCYYHSEMPAVASCKSCYRGICKECSVDVHPGTACKNRCEEDVENLNQAISYSIKISAAHSKAFGRNGISMAMAGITFLGFSLFIAYKTGFSKGAMPSYVIIALLGVIFLVWSYFSYKSAKEYGSKD